MTDIATVTATVEGELVEDSEGVGRRGLSSLLGSIFDDEDVEVVIHDIHDEAQVDDLIARYPDRWEARVDMADDGAEEGDGDAFGFNPIVALSAVECPNCGYVQVADKTNCGYQCAECLTRFGSTHATIHGPNDDPRDTGAPVHEAYK